MSREIKIGILAIVAIFLSIWGYKFVKGQNLFENTKTFTSTFSDVTALPTSAAVLLNGYKVGQVTNIKLNEDNVKLMDVEVRIDGEIPIPKDAYLLMKSEGLVGGKILNLVFDKPCKGEECAETGSKLVGKVLGLLGSMVPAEEIDSYMNEATGSIQTLIRDLGKDGSEGKLNDIIRNLDEVVSGINHLTNASAQLIASSQSNINQAFKSIEAITKNIEANNTNITSTIQNLNKLSHDLSQAQIKSTIENSNKMIGNASNTLQDVSKTLTSLNSTIIELTSLTNGLNKGEGTAGQLLHDKDLYNNLNNTALQLNYLLQDLRLNPKRYINVSLIGRKNKPYIPVDEDPINQ